MKRPGSLSRTGGLSRSAWNVDGDPGRRRRRPTPRQGDPAKAAAREEAQYGPHAAWIRAQPSLVSGRFGQGRKRVQAAHAWHTRGAGGLAADCVPLLRDEERQLHRVGRLTFQDLHAVDLAAAAARYAAHSPALHPEIARRTAVLPCIGCSTHEDVAAVLLPDDSFLAVCSAPRCRAAMEAGFAAYPSNFAEAHHA